MTWFRPTIEETDAILRWGDRAGRHLRVFKQNSSHSDSETLDEYHYKKFSSLWNRRAMLTRLILAIGIPAMAIAMVGNLISNSFMDLFAFGAGLMLMGLMRMLDEELNRDRISSRFLFLSRAQTVADQRVGKISIHGTLPPDVADNLLPLFD